MDSLISNINLIFGGFGVMVNLIMLCLQHSAYRQHGQRGFLLLVASSLFGTGYIFLAWAPSLISVADETFTLLFFASIIFAVISAVFCVWGTSSVFSSYARLAATNRPRMSERGRGPAQ
jgi:hypothetical protein